MRSILALCLLLAIAVYSTGVRAADGLISPIAKLAELKTGDYLSVDFLSQLKKSQSVFATYRSQIDYSIPQLVDVKYAGAETELSLSFGWHEGFFVTIHQNGTVTADELGWGVGTILKASDETHFTLGAKEHLSADYEFIGNDEQFIGGLLLTGTYRDDNDGQTYVFRDDGWALFPGETFTYSIYLDVVLLQSDQFWDETNDKYYAFRRQGDSLQIVLAPERDVDEPDWDHLLWSLHRIGP